MKYTNKHNLPDIIKTWLEFDEYDYEDDTFSATELISPTRQTMLKARYYDDLEIAICPVLAVSENMERLGMGGGFYDKFVEDYPKMRLIALAYEWQVQKELPTEPHDKPLDLIVTEDRIILPNNQF